MSLLTHWVDGAAEAVLAVDDRGLAYGDGLFETMLWSRGRAVWWVHHIRRMSQDAARLGIAAPKPWLWQEDLDAASAWLRTQGLGRAVLRLTLTRGRGGRGYAPPEPATPTRMLQVHAAPTLSESRAVLRLKRCRIHLAVQPALAGIKHLNRLEQVLARRECAQAGMDDGVMFDPAGAVVCTTMGNLLLRVGQEWLTPTIVDCGIAGVLRGQLLRHRLVYEGPISEIELADANALAVCNSVRGILPVTSLDGHPMIGMQETQQLRDALAALEPAFAPSTD